MYQAKPNNRAGAEFLWVQGRHNNKLIADPGPLHRSLGPLWLKLNSEIWTASGYPRPINEMGIGGVINRLVTRCKEFKPSATASVHYRKRAKINKRRCTVIEFRESGPSKNAIARERFFIELASGLPIRVSTLGRGQNKLRINEAYTYLSLKLNVGLTGADFLRAAARVARMKAKRAKAQNATETGACRYKQRCQETSLLSPSLAAAQIKEDAHQVHQG